MIENRFAHSEESFVDMADWDACCTGLPIMADADLPVWVGVDASVKRDSTAIVAVTWDRDVSMARLVFHRIFNPAKGRPINFEYDVEGTLLELKDRFRVREICFDPFQMQASAQRMRLAGLNMVEFPQSVPNLTAASQNLFELIKAQNLIAYRDKDLRLAVQRSVAIENPRGWRIAKEKASHRIDVVVALAQAALAAIKKGNLGRMRMGAINTDGHISWHDSKSRDHSRIRWLATRVDRDGNRITEPGAGRPARS
jgi:phage terminase large subunit-like protein